MNRSEAGGPSAVVRAAFVAAAVASTVVGSTGSAAAAPLAGATAPPSPANDAAFRSGVEQYGKGNYGGAITIWENLIATIGETTGYKVLYNLGLAYQQTGDVTKAIERYRSFLGQLDQRPYIEPDLAARATDARARLAQLEGSHGKLQVLPPKAGPLVLTRVNGGDPRAAGYVVWLAPGVHTVEIFVGTDHAKTVSLEVTKGGSVEVDTTPESPPTTAPRPTEPRPSQPTPPTTSTSGGGSRTLVWIGAGATVFSIALPVGLFLSADARGDDARALGAGHSRYPGAREEYADARTLYAISWALPATLLAVTTVLWLTTGKSDRTSGAARLSDVGRLQF